MQKNKTSVWINMFVIVFALLLVVGTVSALTINGTPQEIKELANKDNAEQECFGASRVNDFWPATVSATTTTTTAGEASVVLLESSARNYAVITNTSATIAYLAMNATSSPNVVPILSDKYYVIPLAASGGAYTINLDNLYLGQLIASSSAAVTIRALEAY